MLLKAYKRPMPMRTQSDEERAAFFKVLKEGLPGFLYSLRPIQKFPLNSKARALESLTSITRNFGSH